MSVGDAKEAVVAVGAVGDACGEPNVACRSGDGSGSFRNVSGAGLFFCRRLMVSSESPALNRSSADADTDSLSFECAVSFEPFLPCSRESRLPLESSVGIGGTTSDVDATVYIEPFEKRDIFDAIEYREYR